jgi:hypothetical protein
MDFIDSIATCGSSSRYGVVNFNIKFAQTLWLGSARRRLAAGAWGGHHPSMSSIGIRANFRNRFWERLMVNVGVVLVFWAFYLRFLKPP